VIKAIEVKATQGGEEGEEGGGGGGESINPFKMGSQLHAQITSAPNPS